MTARRERLFGALEDLLAGWAVRFAAPRRSAWARDALRHDAREEKALAEAKAAPAAALDPPPPAFAEAETEEGSVGRVHLEVDPQEGAPGE